MSRRLLDIVLVPHRGPCDGVLHERYLRMFASLALAPVDNSVDDDIPVISTEALFEASVALENASSEMMDLDQLSSTLDDLELLSEVITTHGVTPSLLAFTNRDQLLSTAMPAFGGCESLTIDAVVDAPESLAAQEELLETIKNMGASWFKAAWDGIVNLGHKVAEFCQPITDKVVAAARWVKEKVYNAAKAAKEVITAHPIASILAALTTAAAIGAVVMAIWGGGLPAALSLENLAAWKTSILSKIRSGLGAVGRGITTTGGKALGFAKYEGGEIKKATGVVLGYTKDGFDKVSARVQSCFGLDGHIKKSTEFVEHNAKTLFDKVKSGGGAVLSVGRQAINWLLSVTRSLWSFATGGIASMATGCLSIFRGLFGTKEEVEKYVSAASVMQNRKPQIA